MILTETIQKKLFIVFIRATKTSAVKVKIQQVQLVVITNHQEVVNQNKEPQAPIVTAICNNSRHLAQK